MSFRLKTVLGIALIEILLLSILVFNSLTYLRGSNEEQLIQRANTSAQLLATMTADAVVAMDLATLDELVEKTATTSGISYIRVRHDAGFVLTERGDEAALAKDFVPDQDFASIKDDSIFDVTAPIKIENEVFGHIELGIGTSSLEVLMKQALNHMALVAGFEIILVGFFGIILGGILTRQLTSLQKGALEISQGNWGHVIAVKGKDELATTAACFNDMSQSLQAYAEELQEARNQAVARRKIAESTLSEAIESVPQGVVITDGEGHIVQINSAFKQLHNMSDQDFEVLEHINDLNVCEADETCENDVMKLSDEAYVMQTKTGLSTGGFVRIDTDLSEIMLTQERNRMLERDLMKSQKMEAVGTLAGGIAHEINTPVQFIGDNLRFLGEASEDMLNILSAWEALGEKLESENAHSEVLGKIRELEENADIDFLRDEMPDAVSQSIDGVKQVSKIVLAMKEFAHPSSKDKASINLNRVIERSLSVCKNEWKTVAMMDFVADDNLPDIPAYESELNQVILNMVVNAAHAIGEANLSDGMIKISTEYDDETMDLIIEDNGPGVPDSIKEQIFDPFFTTKDVGKGSGQGLSICHDIIVKKHGGQIEVSTSELGGAAFKLSFPRFEAKDRDAA